MKEKLGDFYVHIVRSPTSIEENLTSSTKLLSKSGRPSVIHFYNGKISTISPYNWYTESNPDFLN